MPRVDKILNKYKNIENLLNQTFVYDTIEDLEDKNKYLLEKNENFKKGIKNFLEALYQANYDLEMKNKLIQVFEQLEKLLPLSSKNDSNDNKHEELENLKQESHRLNQNLLLKEKELEDYKIANEKYEKEDLTNELDLLNKKLQQSKTNQLRLNEQLNTVNQEKEDLTDELEESLLIKNSDYYQKINYISEPIIISKHKDNNWDIETLPNIKNEKMKKTILLNIDENKILNNLIEQKINITIIFCKKTKKFKEAFFIDKYQNKKIINIENEQQKILEKLNYKIRTEMASLLTQSDINKINHFHNQKESTKSPCLTQEELKRYQNQGAVPKHYKLVPL